MFLLSLAMGSRVSELCSINRDQITFSGEALVVYPHAQFLRKNERPSNRIQPIIIQPLPASNATLCPVANSEKYMEMTAKTVSKSLWVHHSTLRALTKRQVTFNLCRFIKLCNPGSFPKSHDVRKVSTSLAFLTYNDLQEIRQYTGWRSDRVFLRHYYTAIEDITRNIVVLGKPIKK